MYARFKSKSSHSLTKDLWPTWKFRERGERRGVERRRVVERRVELNGPLYLVWMFLKLVRGKGVINHFSSLDVLKFWMERRGNDLNIPIYPYLKINLQH